MENIRLARFVPDGGSRASQRLQAGALTVTVSSKKTMRHITLRLRCRRKGQSGAWATVPYDQATHLFIEDYDWETIATMYPATGVLYFAPKTTEAARWCVEAIFRYVNGDYGVERQAELAVEDICIRCGRPLTDPQSIERGYGPECFGMATESAAESTRER
jgi:hypothetical protein